jgi:hypothetical protein
MYIVASPAAGGGIFEGRPSAALDDVGLLAAAGG